MCKLNWLQRNSKHCISTYWRSESILTFKRLSGILIIATLINHFPTYFIFLLPSVKYFISSWSSLGIERVYFKVIYLIFDELIIFACKYCRRNTCTDVLVIYNSNIQFSWILIYACGLVVLGIKLMCVSYRDAKI